MRDKCGVIERGHPAGFHEVLKSFRRGSTRKGRVNLLQKMHA